MDFLFYHFNSWFWLGTTCLLFFIEILTGTGFLLCLGTSAALMTAISFLFGTFETSTQMIMFSFFAGTPPPAAEEAAIMASGGAACPATRTSPVPPPTI